MFMFVFTFNVYLHFLCTTYMCFLQCVQYLVVQKVEAHYTAVFKVLVFVQLCAFFSFFSESESTMSTVERCVGLHISLSVFQWLLALWKVI